MVFFYLCTVNSLILPLCAKHAKSDYNLYIHLSIIRINFYKAVNYNHAKKCHKKNLSQRTCEHACKWKLLCKFLRKQIDVWRCEWWQTKAIINQATIDELKGNLWGQRIQIFFRYSIVSRLIVGRVNTENYITRLALSLLYKFPISYVALDFKV